MATPLYLGHDDPRNPQKNLTSHYGLWFERFFNQYDRDWAVGDTVKKNWIDDVSGLCGDKIALTAHSISQKKICDNLQGKSQIFKSNWHFVTGMGNNHPVENGMTWHPTLGTPYLSGASVKGLLRSWMEEWSDLDGNELREKIFHWFGSDDKEPKEQQKESQAGSLIFFDALPVDQVTLACDIMTPHMSKWYRDGGIITKENYSNTLPADWHNPIPIPFLVVKQASLQFVIALRPHADIKQGELQKAMDELTKALEYLGAGAKTATGYGRMELNKDISLDPEDMAAKEWLKSTFDQVQKDHRIPKHIEVYISKPLAEEWNKIENPELKQRIFKFLQEIWKEKERRPSKKAQKLYDS